MKLLYFGDMHMDKIPLSRIDDFVSTQINKINEIKKLAIDNNVKALLQGGDFLNRDKVSDEKLSDIIEVWQGIDLKDIVKDVMLGQKTINDLINAMDSSLMPPMIGVAGNHELTGADIGSLEKTSLNLLVKSGFMSLLSKDDPIIIKDESGFTVAITGSHYTHNIDGDDKSAYIVDKKLGDFHIHIVHGMLMDKSYGEKFQHTTISEIAYKTKADLTINGHDHIGYELTRIDNKLFINPGSPFRLKAEKKEIERMPKVLLLNIDKSTGITVEEHYLKSAEKGDDVLSRTHIIKALAKKDKLEEIEDALNKAHLNKGVDITDIIKKIAINEDLDENILNESVELITDKMRELDIPFNPKGEYIIENVTLENFLCHKYTSLDFTEGLNVLYGASRNGKSSVLRGIREVFECYISNPRDFIFYNEDFFKVTLTLSNGYVISRIVERKKSGKNGYEIYDPIKGELNYYNTKALSMVQEILGYNEIKLSDKNKVGINFLNQGESWFFIGKGLSAPDKAKLTGVFYGTQYADAVLKDINAKTKKIVSEINFYDKEIEKLEEEKKKFEYLDEYEAMIIKAENNLKLLEEKEAELERIKEIDVELIKIANEGKILNEIIKEIDKNSPIYTKLYEELCEKNEVLLKIKKIDKEIETITNAGKEASYVVSKLKNVNLAKDCFNEILELNKQQEKDKNDLSKYLKLENEMQLLDNEINTLNNISNELNGVDKAKELLRELEIKQIELNKIKDTAISINQLENNITDNENEVAKQEAYISSKIEVYKKKLLSAGKCPVCNGNIDAVVVESVVKDMKNNN